MIKTCHWCNEKYDTRIQSSMYCESNPKRESNLKFRKMKPSIVTIGVLVLPNRKFPNNK
jgi:hypothetical protein